MKIWLLLSILNCHECIDSSIQSYLVMESCPSLTVSYFHELLNITSSLALSRRPNSSIQSCLGMKVQLYPPVLACHECIDSSIQSYLVMKSWPFHPVWICKEVLTLPFSYVLFNLDFILKSCPFHLVWSYHVQHSFPISFDPKARIWINAQLSKEYVWLCHLQLDSLSSGFVINYLTILFLALSSMSWL